MKMGEEGEESPLPPRCRKKEENEHLSAGDDGFPPPPGVDSARADD